MITFYVRGMNIKSIFYLISFVQGKVATSANPTKSNASLDAKPTSSEPSESSCPSTTGVANGGIAKGAGDASDTKPSCPSNAVTAPAEILEVPLPVVTHRAWADCPQDFDTPANFSDDPTPQEAMLASISYNNRQQQASSDSGGEDSSKENKENAGSSSDNAKNTKKKGTSNIVVILFVDSFFIF